MRSTSCATMSWMLNSWTMRSRPRSPMRRVRSGSLSSCRMASASAWAFSGGTSRPVLPWSMSSGMPAMVVLMTARPVAMASISALGIPSIIPSFCTIDGSTKNVVSFSSLATSASGCAPRRWTQSWRFLSWIMRASSSRIGPVPTRLQSKTWPWSRRMRQASMRYGSPLYGRCEATQRMRCRAGVSRRVSSTYRSGSTP